MSSSPGPRDFATELPRRTTAAIVLAVALAATAGFADSHVFLHVVEVFPANMSGNLVGIGMFVGSDQWALAGLSTAAVVAFVLGVLLGRAVGRPGGTSDWLLVVEALLLSALATYVVLVDPRFSTTGSWIDLPIVVLGSLAMGAQCVALTSIGGVAVTTTYDTGALVRIATRLSLRASSRRRGDRRTGPIVTLLVAVIAAYVVGALLAALAGSSPMLMVVPAAALWAAAFHARIWRITPDSVDRDSVTGAP